MRHILECSVDSALPLQLERSPSNERYCCYRVNTGTLCRNSVIVINQRVIISKDIHRSIRECRLLWWSVDVRGWSNCKDGEAGTSELHDQQRAGGLVIVISVLHGEQATLIQDDRRIPQREITSKIAIKQERQVPLLLCLVIKRSKHGGWDYTRTSETESHHHTASTIQPRFGDVWFPSLPKNGRICMRRTLYTYTNQISYWFTKKFLAYFISSPCQNINDLIMFYKLP